MNGDGIIEAGFGDGGIEIIQLFYTGIVVSDTVGAITCKSLDGSVTGIKVAMPWLLRKAAFDTKTIGGNIYSWTSSFLRNVDPTPAGGGDDWDESIHMPYVVDDVISVVVNTGLITDISNTTTYPYLELSNNRIWGRSCE
jgi:hypothetical protein